MARTGTPEQDRNMILAGRAPAGGSRLRALTAGLDSLTGF